MSIQLRNVLLLWFYIHALKLDQPTTGSYWKMGYIYTHPLEYQKWWPMCNVSWWSDSIPLKISRMSQTLNKKKKKRLKLVLLWCFGTKRKKQVLDYYYYDKPVKLQGRVDFECCLLELTLHIQWHINMLEHIEGLWFKVVLPMY